MNKTVLITGASGGLGREFAAIYAKQKCDLILTARNGDKLRALKEELENTCGVTVYTCAADLAAVDAALDVFNFTREHGLTVDILINNAGFGDSGCFAKSDWQKQYDMAQLNMIALMQLAHCFLPGMTERGRGRILNVSSVAAFCAGPYMPVYFATKAFVRSFSEALAEEVRGTGVTVTALCPGPTATGFEEAAALGEDSAMFRHTAKAADVAQDGVDALEKGRALRYCGFGKVMAFLCRLVPRAVPRKCVAAMSRRP